MFINYSIIKTSVIEAKFNPNRNGDENSIASHGGRNSIVGVENHDKAVEHVDARKKRKSPRVGGTWYPLRVVVVDMHTCSKLKIEISHYY